MRIGVFTVFLISMKFFFSFQLAVYRLIKQIKAHAYVLNRLNLDKLARVKFALNLNLNAILKRKKTKVKSLEFTCKKPLCSVNLTQLYGR